MSQSKSASLMDSRILIPAIGAAFAKLNPRTLAKNPVMFVVAVVSTLTTVLFLRDLVTGGEGLGFSLQTRTSGSGSRCCLPISPKLWPKVAARRRRIRCARPAPKRRQSC